MAGAKESALAALGARRQELAELCARLIRIPSENPPGDTRKIAAFVEHYLRRRGCDTRVYEPRRGMPNVVATLGRGRPNLVLAGHLDEFPAGDGWSFPPFDGLLQRGRILGRGAGDMKAGLAVALFAADLLKEFGGRPEGRLTLAFASDEETGGTWGTQWLLKHVTAVRGDACLIGESSGTWSIGVGEKGVLWLRVGATGRSGHAAYGLGDSAVKKVLGVLDTAAGLEGRRGQPRAEIGNLIRAQRRAAERHWGPGTGTIANRVTVNVGTLRGGGQVNLIPAACEAEIDFRVPPGMTTATILRALSGERGAGRTIEVLNRCESYVTSPKARLVRLVAKNARALCGLGPVPVVRPGYTDGRFFRRAGIPTVVYGPSVHGMGGPDEFIESNELFDVAKVHVGVVFDYLGVH